jgi:hypothetical protein
MTEAELQELAFTAADLAANYSAILITIITGYLFVAYAAGSDLSRQQVVLINILFLFSTSLFTYAVTTCFIKQLEIVTKLKVLAPENFYPVNPVVITGVAVTFIVIILACLHFMWRIRHPKAE